MIHVKRTRQLRHIWSGSRSHKDGFDLFICATQTALNDNEYIYEIDGRQDCDLSVTMRVRYRAKDMVIDRCIAQTICTR